MDVITECSRRKRKNWITLMLAFILTAGFFYGCATPSVKKLSHTRVLQPDQDDNIGGSFTESGDIRTVAVKMTGSLLSIPEIASSEGSVRIAISPIRNSTRFIIDKDIFMKRLRIEMNKNSGGKIRFFSQGMGQKVRKDIFREQDEDRWEAVIDEAAGHIAAFAMAQNSPYPLRVAIIPVQNTNLVGLNADSITALIRARISEKANGRVVFMAREKSGKAIDQILNEGELRDLGLLHSRSDSKIAGVDYFLGGEFIGASLESAAVEQGVKATLGKSKDDPRVVKIEASEVSRRPNVGKYLNVLLMNANTGEIPVEKLVKMERKMKSGLGRADYILTGELSALSKAVQGGDRSDYVIMSFQMIEPFSNELVWEDAYETKKVSRSGVLYK